MNGADRRLLAFRRVAFSGPLGGVLELATAVHWRQASRSREPRPCASFFFLFLLQPAPVSYSLLLIVFFFPVILAVLRNLISSHCLLDTLRRSPHSRRCPPGRPTSLIIATSSAWILGHWRDAGAARTGAYIRYEPHLRQRPNADLRLVKLKRREEKSHSATTSYRDCLFSLPHPSDLRPPSTCLARPARMYLPIPRRTAQPADGSAQLSQATRHLHTLVRRNGISGSIIGAVCSEDENTYWGLKNLF